MSKKILLIGNGAREHAIAEALRRAGSGVEIFAVGKTKNPGIFGLLGGGEYLLKDVCDGEAIRELALRVKPDFAVVGPEAPIAAGIVDMLLEIGVHSASPLQTVGRLESSKSFTRDLVAKYGIPGNPKFKVFYDEQGLVDFFAELGDDFVVKADGLKGGKGVKVSGDHLNGKAEGIAFAKECLADCGRVVIEEKLIGQEFSLMSFCDGINTVEMPCVQDHKRAYVGDKGPNTGGMGTYSDANHSLPFLRTSDIEDATAITQKVAAALLKETGCEFKGVMYGGFMACKSGVRLIEYNVRFGDPEAMNVLPLLKTNFVDLCEAIIHGELAGMKVEFENKATVCKYVVPEGYPDNPVKGVQIEIGTLPAGVRAYYASVDAREGGLYLAGSRAVAMVGIADDLVAAEKLAEVGATAVKGPVFHRKDIGTAELIGKRVEMMKNLRLV
ncbi:phosphoribosylamine--glycine ligase [Candidatus Peregrinibacteria bacterium]|nr:phosphoribosylamine--glycine ligase [Candidatus Peregrinibacteria bacterium]